MVNEKELQKLEELGKKAIESDEGWQILVVDKVTLINESRRRAKTKRRRRR